LRLYIPYRPVDLIHQIFDDVNGEIFCATQGKVECCFEGVGIRVEYAAGDKVRFYVYVVVFAGCFKPEDTEDVVAINSVGEIPEFDAAGNGSDILRNVKDKRG
jgi:hypothetical protein